MQLLKPSIDYAIIQRCLDPENQLPVTEKAEQITQLIQATYGTSQCDRMRAYWALCRLESISKFKQVGIDFDRSGIIDIKERQAELLTVTNPYGDSFKYQITFSSLGMLRRYKIAFGLLLSAQNYRVITRKIYCLGLEALEAILPYEHLRDELEIISYLSAGFNAVTLAAKITELENQARHYLKGNLEPLLLILEEAK
jgi:hypothetical protein